MSETAVPQADLLVRSRRHEGLIYLEREGRTWRLDQVGSLIWESIDGRRSLAGICQAISAEYPDAPAAQIAADVSEFIDMLAERGFVSMEPV
jgi:hypothetical protein